MKLHNISADSLGHEFRLLRNRIETQAQAPALVFVTSATDDDGTGFAAHGLATSLSRTHQRTVLVTSDPTLAPALAPGADPAGGFRRRASDKIDGTARAQSGGSFSVVCLSAERVATISRTHVTEMVQELRASNDYVVIDGGNLAKNGIGLLLVGLADVAIVAFRAGRTQQPADRLMLDALERAEAKVIGVVMTDQDSIDHFARRNEPSPAVEVVQPPEPKRTAVLREKIGLALSRLVRSG